MVKAYGFRPGRIAHQAVRAACEHVSSVRSWVVDMDLDKELDGWIRRKLRCILWRQWKRAFTRARNLMKRGLSEDRAWRSATNGRGPWWNSGASHVNQAVPKKYFDALGLRSLQSQLRKFKYAA